MFERPRLPRGVTVVLAGLVLAGAAAFLTYTARRTSVPTCQRQLGSLSRFAGGTITKVGCKPGPLYVDRVEPLPSVLIGRDPDNPQVGIQWNEARHQFVSVHEAVWDPAGRRLGGGSDMARCHVTFDSNRVLVSDPHAGAMTKVYCP